VSLLALFGNSWQFPQITAGIGGLSFRIPQMWDRLHCANEYNLQHQSISRHKMKDGTMLAERERERELFLKKRLFTCGSASATVVCPEPYVYLVRYAGLMCRDCFDDLRAEIVDSIESARIAVFDYSEAMFLIPSIPTFSNGKRSSINAPVALVVKEEDFAIAQNYTYIMADLGVMRCVFLPWEKEKLKRWVGTITGRRALEEYSRLYDKSVA
jgi:hypothetical protein